MARIKYYYDTEKCKYERVKVKPSDVILQIVVFLLLAVMLGCGGTILWFLYNPTPNDIMLARHQEVQNDDIKVLSDELGLMESSLAELQDRDRNIYRVVTGAKDLPESIRGGGTGGVHKYHEILERGTSIDSLIYRKLSQIDQIKQQLKIQAKSYEEIYDLAINKEKMWASIPAIQPVPNKDLKRLASGFGWRIHPIYKVRKFHTGIDFSAKIGTAIYATGDGVISKVKTSYSGYGKEIEIDHGFGYITKYAHMHSFEVKLGQKVKRGEQIGKVGNTGTSTGAHLHYEVILNSEKVNPVHYFFNDVSPEEYEEILKLASIENQSMS